MAKTIMTANFSEPLTEVTTATIDIDIADGNLTIDKLADNEGLLASGTLQYLEDQGLPTRSAITRNGRATMTLKAKSTRRAWIHLPWQACNGATQWQIHLNPHVNYDITVRSGGGNIKLDLADMAVTGVSVDTGGGNLEVRLPDHSNAINVIAKSGAGNVTVAVGGGTTGNNLINAGSGAGNVVVDIPPHMAACVHATTGLGKTILDSRLTKIDGNTYQSADYDVAVDKLEISAHSGAGNVTVNAKQTVDRLELQP
jgi:hypothetical protein